MASSAENFAKAKAQIAKIMEKQQEACLFIHVEAYTGIVGGAGIVSSGNHDLLKDIVGALLQNDPKFRDLILGGIEKSGGHVEVVTVSKKEPFFKPPKGES